jgi:uncharacterized protein DUF2635
MRVKPVDPNAVIRDPHTMQRLPAEGGDVPDNVFWTRRLLAGEVVRIDVASAPAGTEPVAPLTTRGGK